jgi:hypothetical protein
LEGGGFGLSSYSLRQIFFFAEKFQFASNPLYYPYSPFLSLGLIILLKKERKVKGEGKEKDKKK